MTGILELKIILERFITVITLESASEMNVLGGSGDNMNVIDKGGIEMSNFSAYW